jgi:hypothetical protein
MLYLVHLVWFELTPVVVIYTDCIGSCKSNYHASTTTTATTVYVADKSKMFKNDSDLNSSTHIDGIKSMTFVYSLLQTA